VWCANRNIEEISSDDCRFCPTCVSRRSSGDVAGGTRVGADRVENFFDQHYEPAFGSPGLPINARTGVTIAIGGR